MRWLRRIRGRSRREKVRNEKKTREELWARETVVENIKKWRLLWFGHVEWVKVKKTTNRGFTWTRGGKEKQRETRKIWMDNVREDLREKNIDLTRMGEATRNKGLEKSYKSLIVSSLMEEQKEKKKKKADGSFFFRILSSMGPGHVFHRLFQPTEKAGTSL